MTSSTHSQYNYNRRNSTTSPYSIPMKHQSGYHVQGVPTTGHGSGTNFQVQGGGQVSTSVPTLSREFVVRRISEGETGRLKEELKCEACGKGYKHISSLAKHLWEHTPEWNVTKKLLISKHQQVQLLEAASILVGMNETSTSRRNSVFQDDEDVKYPSAFSPVTSSETNPTSNEPTPPVNNEPLDREISVQDPRPKFKNAFDSAPGELYEPSGSQSRDYTRSDSISHFPPSETIRTQPSSLTTGGYLDSVKSRQQSITGSIYEPHRFEPSDDFRSPSTSYKSNKMNGRQFNYISSSNFNSPKLNSPESRHNNDELEKEGRSPLDDDDDEVIGKME